MKKIILFLPLLLLVSVIPAYSQETTTQELYVAHDTLTQFWLSNSQYSQFSTSDITEQSPELPIFIIFVNPNTNELVIGIDYDTTQSIDDLTIQVENIIGSDVPFSLKRGYVIEETCNAVDKRCDPLWGAVEISTPKGSTSLVVSTLTLPAITNNGKYGFIMSGHGALENTNVDISQPNENNLDSIIVGTVITNPAGSGILLARSSDSAFVEEVDGFSSEQKIFNPNGAPYNVIGTRASQVFDDIILGGTRDKIVNNSVVKHTTGQVLSTGVPIELDSSSWQLLTNQVIADYISIGGDSGAPIFSISNGNDVEFHGLHVGATCFTDNPPTAQDDPCPAGSTVYRFYSPWESIQNELNLKDIDGTFDNPISIPSWIKNNAGWWADGSIDDDSFVNGIQFLIKERIIQIPPTSQGSSSGNIIPSWIKNNAGWWADGSIDDETFVTALDWLIQNGIIQLSSTSSNNSLNYTINPQEYSITANLSITPADDTSNGCQPDCFSPSVLSVNVGDTVTFSNKDSIPHTFTSGSSFNGPDGIWDSTLVSSESNYSITLNDEGIFPYYSMVNPWMSGSIIVGAPPVNDPPTSNAGNNQSVDENTIVILDGTGSADPEGSPLLYSWIQTSGSIVSLSGSNFPGGISNSQTPFFTAPDVISSEILTFSLTVKDNILQSDTDTVSITVNNVVETVNNQPTADAGVDQIVDENILVTLDGTGSFDPDGDPITYEWEQTQGTGVTFDTTAQNPTFTAPEVNGITNLQFKLIVRDDSGVGSSPDFVTITINDVPPPPTNDPPNANNDLFQIVGTDPANLDVLFNDSDPNGDAITIISVNTTGTAGIVTNNGVDITFDGTEGFTGTTTFTYTISDASLIDTAQVTVDVFAAGGDDNAIWYTTNPDVTGNANFGKSVTVLANGKVVGATNDKIFVLDGTTGNSLTSFENPNTPSESEFGWDIDSIGNNIIVGNPSHDVGASSKVGEAFVFSDTGVIKFGGALQNPEPEAFDRFGRAVTATSNKIFVGAPGNDVIVTESSSSTNQALSSLNSMPDSSLELLINDATSTAQIVEKTTLEPLIQIPITINYNEALASAAVSEDNDIINDEAPPTLEVDSTTGELTLFDGTTGDELVSVNQNQLQSTKNNNLVLFSNEQTGTSYLFNGITGQLVLTEFSSAGSVYVFDGTTGAYISPPIDNPRPATSDLFGSSLASFGNNIVVGVPGDDENGGGSGSVYVFDGNTKAELHYIVNPSVGGGSGDDFGESVGAAGNNVVVGAPDDDTAGSNDGAIYIYDGTTGIQKAYLTNPNPELASSSSMGESVSINANGITVAGAQRAESAFVYSFDGNNATFLKKISNPDAGENADFGESVALLNDDIVIGIIRDDPFFAGAVTLYSSIPPPNTPPVAINDSAVATNDTPVVIDVLFNDTDADGHSLTVDSVNISGTQGTVTNNGNDVTFTANLNFDGVTTFSYRASDSDGGLSNTAIVTVSVSDTLAPVITLFGDNPQIIEIGDGYFELGATTDDGSSFTIDISEFTDAVGSYMIYYDSTDVNGNIATTITRTVNVVDTTSLTITAPADQTFEATAVFTPLSESDYGTAIATDDNDPLLTITNDAPAEFQLGDTMITWTVVNSASNSATDIQIITVQDTTDPILTITGDNPQTIELGSIYTELGATALDNIDGDISTDIVIDASVVDVNTAGSYPAIYNVADSSGNSPITEFRNVIVIPSNVPPTVDDVLETIDEDTVVTITLSGTDLDGDSLSFSIVTSPTQGTLGAIISIDAISASVTYTPTSNFNGDDSFTYNANDGTADSSNIATVSITINPINDPPTAVDDSVETNEDTPITIPVLDNDIDVDDNTLIVTEESADDSTPVSFDDSNDLWWKTTSFSFTSMFAKYTPAIESIFENILPTLVPSIFAVNDSMPSVTVDKMNSLESVIPDDTKFEKNKNEIKQARAEYKQLNNNLNDANDDLKEQKKQFTKAEKSYENAQQDFDNGLITSDELAQANVLYQDASDALQTAQDNFDQKKLDLKNVKASMKVSKQIKKLIDGTSNLEKLDKRFTQIFKNIQSDGTPVAEPKIPIYLRVTDQNIPDLSGYEITAQNDKIIVLKLTPAQIEELSLNDNVGEITLPEMSESFSHDVSQGVSLSFANDLHSQNITGNGITVGIIDDSFVTSDPEISGNIKDAILFDSGGFCGDVSCGNIFGNSHGTAVAETVVDMAPNVDLVLYTIANTVDFVNAVDDAIARGDVDVITISLGFPTVGGDGTTGFFRDGSSIVAKAVDRARDAGILVTTAAGNDAKRHWMGTYTPSTISPEALGLVGYQSVMEFRSNETSVQKACLPVFHAGWTVASWNAWDVTSDDYDLFLFDSNMSGVAAFSAIDQQNIPSSPIEVIFDGTGFSGCLVLASMNSTQNHLFHITTVGGSITSDFISTGSINTPADAAGSFAVGAINHATNTLESFSSHGPTDDGRLTPQICGFDGTLSHQSLFDPFFGTSASAPHVAGAAALVKQAQPGISLIELQQQLTSSAIFDTTYSVDNLCGNNSGLLSVQGIDILDGEEGSSGGSESDEGNQSTGDLLSILTITDPANGSAVINPDNTVTYTPDQDFFGEDTFDYTVSDGNGGSDIGTVTIDVISVNDTPVITLVGNDPEIVESNIETYIDAGATAFDIEDGDITVDIIIVNPVDESTLGTYIVTYDVIDSSASPAIQIIRTVNVVDTIPPIFPDPADFNVEATSVTGAIATYSTPVATDAVDPSPVVSCTPVSGSLLPLGDTTITCTATDTSSNSYVRSFIINVVDTTPPVVTDPADVTAEATGITTPVDIGVATATDIFPITSITSDAPATFPLGDTLVHWTATDENGNSFTTSTQTITIQDTTPPVLDPLSDITIDATSFDGAIVNYDLPAASDIVDSSPLVSCEPASGSQFPVGDIIIECTATDFSDNSIDTSFTITVNPFATPGKITAGGAQLNKDINFGFTIQSDDAITFKGELQYNDKSAGIKLHSEEMIRLAIIPGGTTAQLVGIAKDGSTFTILVEDNGEPGKNDFFSITIKDSDGQIIYEQEGNLSKGNIQIHKEKSKN